jgi:hypothetical protein
MMPCFAAWVIFLRPSVRAFFAYLTAEVLRFGKRGGYMVAIYAIR